MDATLDRTYLVDGQPASVLDVHDVLRSGVSSRLTFQGSSLRRIPDIEHIPSEFRHIYALQTNGVSMVMASIYISKNVSDSCI